MVKSGGGQRESDGRTLASAGDDRTVRLWDVAGHRQPVRSLRGHHRPRSLRRGLQPRRSTVATSQRRQTVRLWEVRHPPPTRRGRGTASTGPAPGRLQPRRAHARLRQRRRTVRLWDVARAHADGAAPDRPPSAVYGVAFSPDGRTLASGATTTRCGCGTSRTHRPLGRPSAPHGASQRRRVQPRRTHPRLCQRRQDGAAVGRGEPAPLGRPVRPHDAVDASRSAPTGARSPPPVSTATHPALGRRRHAIAPTCSATPTRATRWRSARRAHARLCQRRQDGCGCGIGCCGTIVSRC